MAARKIKGYTVVPIGDHGVGKTALTIQFTMSVFITQDDPTLVDSYRRQYELDNEFTLFTIPRCLLDSSRGYEHFSSILREDGSEGFLLVYSITSHSSFEEISRLHREICKVKRQDTFPAVLVANKCDLESERQVSVKEGRDLARDFRCPLIETSAKERINVDEAFHDLVREIRKLDKRQQNTNNVAGNQGRPEHEDATSSCCNNCVVL